MIKRLSRLSFLLRSLRSRFIFCPDFLQPKRLNDNIFLAASSDYYLLKEPRIVCSFLFMCTPTLGLLLFAVIFFPVTPFRLSCAAKKATRLMSTHKAVITFDLDDTLWPTKLVIGAANEALSEHLLNELPPIAAEMRGGRDEGLQVWQIMNNIYSQDPKPYKGSDDLDGSRGAVQLSSLRMAAIRQIYRASTNSDGEEDSFTRAAFQIWADARHKACDDFLAEGVVQKISDLRSTFVIGAVTNGNADVFQISKIKDLFDFSVASENVGVAKPNKIVFEEAVRIAPEGSTVEKWIHVGDDVMRDVVPAKSCGMKAIWSREFLTAEKAAQFDDDHGADKIIDKFSELDVAEVMATFNW